MKPRYSNTDNPVDFPQQAIRGQSIDSVVRDPVRMRKRCEALVTAMVGKELAEKWWNDPNKAFCGDTPEQIYSVAPSAVYAHLMKTAQGE
jgi:hypothetical protein